MIVIDLFPSTGIIKSKRRFEKREVLINFRH